MYFFNSPLGGLGQTGTAVLDMKDPEVVFQVKALMAQTGGSELTTITPAGVLNSPIWDEPSRIFTSRWASIIKNKSKIDTNFWLSMPFLYPNSFGIHGMVDVDQLLGTGGKIARRFPKVWAFITATGNLSNNGTVAPPYTAAPRTPAPAPVPAPPLWNGAPPPALLWDGTPAPAPTPVPPSSGTVAVLDMKDPEVVLQVKAMMAETGRAELVAVTPAGVLTSPIWDEPSRIFTSRWVSIMEPRTDPHADSWLSMPFLYLNSAGIHALTRFITSGARYDNIARFPKIHVFILATGNVSSRGTVTTPYTTAPRTPAPAPVPVSPPTSVPTPAPNYPLCKPPFPTMCFDTLAQKIQAGQDCNTGVIPPARTSPRCTRQSRLTSTTIREYLPCDISSYPVCGETTAQANQRILAERAAKAAAERDRAAADTPRAVLTTTSQPPLPPQTYQPSPVVYTTPSPVSTPPFYLPAQPPQQPSYQPSYQLPPTIYSDSEEEEEAQVPPTIYEEEEPDFRPLAVKEKEEDDKSYRTMGIIAALVVGGGAVYLMTRKKKGRK